MDTQSTIKIQRQQESRHILARTRNIIPAILAQYPVAAAYVYGSVARGTVTPLSDIDIALLLAAPLPPYEQLKLELSIQADFADAEGIPPVDVRTLNRAPLLVQGRIVQQGILIYERDRAARVAFEVATRKRYFDFEPVARRLQDAFLKHVRQKGLFDG